MPRSTGWDSPVSPSSGNVPHTQGALGTAVLKQRQNVGTAELEKFHLSLENFSMWTRGTHRAVLGDVCDHRGSGDTGRLREPPAGVVGVGRPGHTGLERAATGAPSWARSSHPAAADVQRCRGRMEEMGGKGVQDGGSRRGEHMAERCGRDGRRIWGCRMEVRNGDVGWGDTVWGWQWGDTGWGARGEGGKWRSAEQRKSDRGTEDVGCTTGDAHTPRSGQPLTPHPRHSRRCAVSP